MKFLIALPDTDYYLWQMLVQMNNLKKHGYDKDTIYVIGKTSRNKSDALTKIIRESNTKCSFFVYNDDRTDYSYSPSMTANILKKLFRDNPSFTNETFFYIDPDVIFRKKIRFSDLLKNDTWYLSDTTSYINSKYIKSKGDELFVEMCNVVGIEPDVVVGNDANAGGAQCIMKNLTVEYWEKVERDSVELHKLMTSTAHKYNPEAPIQAWTAEMWAVLWNAWLLGHETKIIKRFDFSWATDHISKWGKTNIFHNAGAINDKDNTYFVKTAHQKFPFGKDLICSDEYCSSKYVEEIRETEKTFENILK